MKQTVYYNDTTGHYILTPSLEVLDAADPRVVATLAAVTQHTEAVAALAREDLAAEYRERFLGPDDWTKCQARREARAQEEEDQHTEAALQARYGREGATQIGEVR